MLNAEKYKEEILKMAKNGHTFAKKANEITKCKTTPCKDCEFHEGELGCYSKRMLWLYDEYRPLKIKERETTFTLSICYSDRVVFRVLSIHKSKDGTVYAWCEGVNKDNDNYFFNTWDYDFLNECYQKGELILC